MLRALARWGFPCARRGGTSDAGRPVVGDPRRVHPVLRPRGAAGVDEHYLLILDGEEFWLSSVPGQRLDGTDEADLMLEGPSWAFMAMRQDSVTLADLIDDGTLQRTKGTAKIQRNFERVFSLARPATTN